MWIQLLNLVIIWNKKFHLEKKSTENSTGDKFIAPTSPCPLRSTCSDMSAARSPLGCVSPRDSSSAVSLQHVVHLQCHLQSSVADVWLGHVLKMK